MSTATSSCAATQTTLALVTATALPAAENSEKHNDDRDYCRRKETDKNSSTTMTKAAAAIASAGVPLRKQQQSPQQQERSNDKDEHNRQHTQHTHQVVVLGVCATEGRVLLRCHHLLLGLYSLLLLSLLLRLHKDNRCARRGGSTSETKERENKQKM